MTMTRSWQHKANPRGKGKKKYEYIKSSFFHQWMNIIKQNGCVWASGIELGWNLYICRIIYSSPYYSLFTDLGWDVCQFNYHLLLANFEFNFRKWNLLLASKLAKVPVERLQAGRLAVAPWSIYRDSVSLYLLKHRPGGIIFPMQSMQQQQQAVGKLITKTFLSISGSLIGATCHLKVVFLRDYSHFYLILPTMQKSVDCTGY